MTLAADAISHIALPGIGLAILLRIHPILGGVAALLVGTLLVWGIEGRTRLATETIIGVVFSTALAVGSLITSGDELVEALFGGVGHLTMIEATLGLFLSMGVVLFVVWQRHRLVLALVSPGERAHGRDQRPSLESLLPTRFRADHCSRPALPRRSSRRLARQHSRGHCQTPRQQPARQAGHFRGGLDCSQYDVMSRSL